MSNAVERLRIVPNLREALLLPLHHWQFASSLMVGPVVLLTISRIPLVWMNPQESAIKVAGLLSIIVLIGVLTTLAVSWHRFILLNEQSGSVSRLWRWSRRETRFLLYGIAIAIVWWLVGMIAVIPVAVVSGIFIGDSLPVAIILGGVGALVILGICGYFCGPISLILPATAIDRRPASSWFDWAWTQSKDNEWALAALVFIIPFPVLWLLDHISGKLLLDARQSTAMVAIGMVALESAIDSLSTIFAVGVLSIAYKRLFPTTGLGQEPTELATVPLSE